MNLFNLPSFPAGDNPYMYDHVHMGQSVDDNILIMYAKHQDNDYIIVVDRRTGNRARIDIKASNL